MSPANSIALIVNAVTIPLALFMLILLLWQDYRSSENIFFAVLMTMIVLWAVGVLLARTTAYIGGPDELVRHNEVAHPLAVNTSCRWFSRQLGCFHFPTRRASGVSLQD